MNHVPEIENDQMIQLEKCILFDGVFVGQSQDNKRKIEAFFKTQSFKAERVEELMLLYVGGDKLIENRLEDSNCISHVFERTIYDNILDIFDCYVQNSTKSCEDFILFIEKVIDQMSDCNKVSKFLFLNDYLCLGQTTLVCNLYSSLLKYVKMTNYQRLDTILRLMKFCKRYSCYNCLSSEFIFEKYYNALPFSLSESQKEEIKKVSIYKFFFEK